MNNRVYKMILAALMLALCFLLPFLTGQIPAIGQALSPMHIPVFLCGFLCGMPWAPIVGFLAPVMRSMIIGMPPMFPTAVAMSFELAAYGLLTALLSKKLTGSAAHTYVTLIISMLFGRAVWGVVSWLLYGISGGAFTIQMFIAGAFTNAVPGIICHLIVVPAIVLALRKAGIIKE